MSQTVLKLPASQKLFPNLDLLRSVAVSVVLLSHLVMSFDLYDHPISKALAIKELGMLGVLLFFIHTSLVLMMSLDRLGPVNLFQRFYIRRVFRIYPLAIAAIALALFFHIPPHFEPTYQPQSISVIIQNVLLVENFFKSPEIVGPMWTLPLEMQMYLTLPFIYLAARRLQSPLGVATLIGSGFLVWAVDHKLSTAFDYWPIFPFAPWFFMGIAAYTMMQIVKPRLSPAYFVAALILLMIGQIVVNALIGGYRSSWAMWAVGIIFALLLPYYKDLQSKWAVRGSHLVAKYSYGIYLSHVPIIWFAFNYLSDQPLVLKLSTFLCLIVGVPWLSYHFLEDPMISFGAKLADNIKHRGTIEQGVVASKGS
jgi:peptidoglycan/LPS O-acetylase OafA/YrhL